MINELTLWNHYNIKNNGPLQDGTSNDDDKDSDDDDDNTNQNWILFSAKLRNKHDNHA